MRQKGGSRGARTRRVGWTGDRRGNMQVVEVMIVGLLVVSAVVAVSTMNVPVTETEGFKQDNERLVKDSLQAMLSRPSDRAMFGSLLEEHVMEAVANNPKGLMEHLNKTLPRGAQYNVYLDNHHGSPIPLVEQGTAPREAVAGAIQFVPKLAYTFMIPEFALYHGDFDMNNYAIPIQNGVLLRDEGEAIELAVTVQPMNDDGVFVGDPVVIKTYSHTALRMNDPAKRSWPSVSLWYEDEADPGVPRYRIDASDTIPYQDRLRNLHPRQGDAFNITFTLQVEETANIKVPKNAQVTLEFPRGFDFNKTKRDWVANSTGPEGTNNNVWWKDWTFRGSFGEGWTVTAKTKETFRATSIPLVVSSNYLTILDTAYPFYSPITVAMGNGVQGHTNLVLDTPSVPVTGAYGREAYLSVAKPLISGTVSPWGMAFANDGAGTELTTADRVRIENITLRSADGKAIFTDIQHTAGWIPGEWKEYGPGHWYWKNATGTSTELAEATQIDLAFDVTAGHTTDNSYRNQDYLEVLTRFNPENTTTASVNTLGEWEFEKRNWRMGGEWVYRDSTPPYDDIPGWPDQGGEVYWITGGTFAYKKSLPGNTTFGVLPSGAAANAFGGYQGAHVASSLQIVNEKGDPDRDFDLGDHVHIRNDFQALFGKLSSLQSDTFSVSDLTVRTSVYTPEKAWKGIPAEVYTQQAEIAAAFGSINTLLSGDLNKDGTPDLIVVGSGGVVYALDGRDGAKLWIIETGTATTAAELVDADDDGTAELVIGFDDALLRAYTTSTKGSIVDRLLWEQNVKPDVAWGVPPWQITDLVETRSDTPGEPDIIVGMSATKGQSRVAGLEVVPSASAPWTTSVTATYNASALLPTDPAAISALESVSRADWGDPTPHVVVASMNKTVTMLSLPDLKVQWIKQVPSVVDRIIAADLDGDGHEDLVADTLTAPGLTEEGKQVFTLSGRSGEFGPEGRKANVLTTHDVWDAVFTPLGAFATQGTKEILADPDGLYAAEYELVSEHSLNGAKGLYASPNGTVYMLDRDGEVYQTTYADPLNSGFDWIPTAPPRSIGPHFAADLHIEDTWSEGGRLYQILNSTLISYTTDAHTGATYTDLTSLCSHATLPDAGLPCGMFTAIMDWEVETDEDGLVEAFWTLAGVAGSPHGKVHLHRFDVASGTWTEKASWTDDGTGKGYVRMDRTTNGTIWLSGLDDALKEGAILEITPLGVQREHMVWRAEGETLSAIHVQEDGTGWAASANGTVYRRANDTTWIPFYTSGFVGGTSPVLVEAPDGTVWMIGKSLRHIPLTAYAQKSTAQYGSYTYDLTTTDTSLSVTITAREGHLGGTTEPVDKEALTKVRWYAQIGEGEPVLLTSGTTPYAPKVYTRTHTGQVPCGGVCTGAEVSVWAELENGWRTEAGTTISQGGLTPVIKEFDLEFLASGGGSRAYVDVQGGSLTAGSTAVHSTFYKGAILGESRLPWTFFGSADVGDEDEERHIGVSPTSLVDGSDGIDVVVIQRSSAGLERWVLSGESGVPERPTDLSSFGFTSSDRVTGLLVMDATGDAANDVVMFGKFGSGSFATRVWDVAADANHDAGTATDSNIRKFVSLGMANGRAIFGYGDQNRVHVLEEGLVTGTPSLKWTSAPTEDQGKATFEYEVPLNAMYGTGVVVSELRFDIVDNGVPVTQTARLVDWFNIKPPGREVPRPPIYTVQIVSWFNEA